MTYKGVGKMPRISTDNYDTVASWNGSQDLFVVEQPDGTKVATPAMVKQFIEAGDFMVTGDVGDGDGNILSDLASQVLQLNNNITFQTSGEWRWIELPNKFVFMWCNHNFGELGNLVQEGQFYRTAVPQLDYPFTFASLPGVWVQKQKDGQGLIIGTGTGGTTTKTPDFTIARFTSGTMIYGCTLSFFVVGIKA